jgi:hypothetical protein
MIVTASVVPSSPIAVTLMEGETFLRIVGVTSQTTAFFLLSHMFILRAFQKYRVTIFIVI